MLMAQGTPRGNNVTKSRASNIMCVSESRTSKGNAESHSSQDVVTESRTSKTNDFKESRASQGMHVIEARASKSNDVTESLTLQD